ncbi:hypothetical protein WA026_016873 [Henosepilachna vigintioctopunctata]|uniref:Centromere/kinetochore protein zw10-like protein n=1 Tax=Henosepilachna vigintioctopunctata TaxID=420089 RepID=A0AAW1U2K1_9CUCU
MCSISEIFSTKENIEFDDVISKLPEIDEKLKASKREVSSYLTSVEEKIEEQPRRNKQHTFVVNRIRRDLLSLKSCLNNLLNEDIISAENEYKNSIDELEAIDNSILIVKVICEIHERIQELSTLSTDYTNFEKLVELVRLLQRLLKSFPSDTSIPIVEELDKMINGKIENINSLLTEEFHNNCVLIKEGSHSMIKIPKNVDVMHCLLPAIYKNDFTSDMIDNLSKFIWDGLFLPVIKCNCGITLKSEESFEVMEVDVFHTETSIIYNTIFENIILITKFLEKLLNCSLDSSMTLLNFIGRRSKCDLAKIILKECIHKSIPDNWKDFNTFETDLIKSTEELAEILKPHNLFDEEWKYVYKMKEVYCKNKCQYFNEKAREVMRKDLHIIIEVGTMYDPQKPLLEIDEFMRCSISSYMLDFVNIGEELINEICDGPAENREDLFMTYKGIFFNYGDFVAAYHQKLLEAIPQQVAVFYNNCRYLHRQLREWDETFEGHEILSKFCDDSAKAFHQVEEVGRLFFESFIEEQKKQIENILAETNLQNKKTLDKLEENTEKLIRQCLRQQELLKTVWSKVLSYTDYNENIGDIFNCMCRFIINAFTNFEDIEAVVAEHLIEIFKIIVHRGPKLFTDSNEVFIYVPLWHKFNELIFVLGASLVDIDDRWADGKGPLALQFKPYELKGMIRALFQNTDRRAAILAKIRD